MSDKEKINILGYEFDKGGYVKIPEIKMASNKTLEDKIQQLEKQNKIMRDALLILQEDDSGDLDFIKFKINSILKQAEEV